MFHNMVPRSDLPPFNRLEGFFVFYSLNQKSYLLMGFAIPHFIPWVLLATHGHYNRGG